MSILGSQLGLWAAFAVILGALVFYAVEEVPLAVTSLAALAALMVVFQLVPVPDAAGQNLLRPERLLSGFASPALAAVIALMVIGQGLVRTGLMERVAGWVILLTRGSARVTSALVLFLGLAFSSVLNNTPVVVLFIPIMQTLSERLKHSASYLMMPLNFAVIAGGMTTLIGSSTNLLVHGQLLVLTGTGFGFFDFTVPGLVLAALAYVYAVTVAPRLLPDRAALVAAYGGDGKQFIAQIAVKPGSALLGLRAREGAIAGLRDVTVRMIQRGESAILPPFEDIALEAGDLVVVAATRKALTEAVKGEIVLLHTDDGLGEPEEPAEARRRSPSDQMLAELMVTPTSRLVGQAIGHIAFRYRFGCIVLGVGRRARMILSRMTEIRLEPGDVLLVQGSRSAIAALRGHQDLMPMEWSATELPAVQHATRALLIFAAVVATSASELLPIAAAAVAGAALMLLAGVLNIRQASRAVDRDIVLTIAAAFAMGLALDATGGDRLLADLLLGTTGGGGPALTLSLFFLATAVLTQVISNNACAILTTPVGLELARTLGVPAEPFAVAVVFAANCSFATPIGYQTNLLVMGPGHYTFLDFARAGTPLVLLLWLGFSLFAPWYYGL